jgi:hypothetical protein
MRFVNTASDRFFQVHAHHVHECFVRGNAIKVYQFGHYMFVNANICHSFVNVCCKGWEGEGGGK